MKILLLLLLPAICLGQGKAEKSYKDSAGRYLIVYNYDTHYSMQPAVEGAQPHYDASITVFRLIPLKCGCEEYQRVQIGNTMRGYYVPEGCFEDVPAEWVRKAKEKPHKK